jgi:hypothetical protein
VAKVVDPAVVVSRHIDEEGRLMSIPRRYANRRIVLAHIAVSIEPGRDHDEKSVNERLRPYSDDVATLRRYLVDEGLVSRRPPGIYRRDDTAEGSNGR